MEVTEADIVTPVRPLQPGKHNPDGGDRGGIVTPVKPATTREDTILDGGDRGRYRHTRQTAANHESIIPDGGDRAGIVTRQAAATWKASFPME